MRKKDKANKNQKELFDTESFYRTTSFPSSWYELLSNHDEEFLTEILVDVSYIDYVESKLIITFGNNTSYNFFRLSMLNDVSKRKIEKIFKSIYGEEVTITIRKLTKGQKVDKREI